SESTVGGRSPREKSTSVGFGMRYSRRWRALGLPPTRNTPSIPRLCGRTNCHQRSGQSADSRLTGGEAREGLSAESLWSHRQTARDRRMLLLTGILFFASGFAALLYQIAWQHALFGWYGVDLDSVSTIVSVFMLGLGFGAMIGGWLADHFQ